MLAKKIPPVRMDGRLFKADVITQDDYDEALRAQEIVLLAEGEARRILGQLRVRIERGAIEQSDMHYYDGRLGLVRSRTSIRKGPGRAEPGAKEAQGVS